MQEIVGITLPCNSNKLLTAYRDGAITIWDCDTTQVWILLSIFLLNDINVKNSFKDGWLIHTPSFFFSFIHRAFKFYTLDVRLIVFSVTAHGSSSGVVMLFRYVITHTEPLLVFIISYPSPYIHTYPFRISVAWISTCIKINYCLMYLVLCRHVILRHGLTISRRWRWSPSLCHLVPCVLWLWVITYYLLDLRYLVSCLRYFNSS